MKFKLALAQMAMSEDASENIQKAVENIKKAAHAGADVVCLPELFKSRYFCQKENRANFDMAETIPGPSTKILCETASKEKVVVIASLFEKRAPGVYHNTAVVIGKEGTIIGTYRKMHIPDDPSYYEKYYFSPGDLGFKSFDTAVGKIGVLVCWDQWYPEAARLTALKGADIIIYPTAIGWHPEEKSEYGAAQLDAWRTVQRGHAIANGVFVAAVNRVGFEKPDNDSAGLEFWGSSFVSSPFGELLASASSAKEELLVQEIDLDSIERTRRNWPFLRDRRIDAYADITNRFTDA